MNLVLNTPMGQDAVKDFNKMRSDLFGGITSALGIGQDPEPPVWGQ